MPAARLQPVNRTSGSERVRTGLPCGRPWPRRHERHAWVGTVTPPPGNPPGGTEDEEDDVADTYNGYCVKCREKRDFEGEVSVSDSGRRMAKGKCPVCGTTMNRILGKA